MTPKEILIAARARIEDGWCQWVLNTGESYCAMGAIEPIVGIKLSSEQEAAVMALFNCLQKPVLSEVPIEAVFGFNDLPTTTKADVLALYDRAIAGLE